MRFVGLLRQGLAGMDRCRGDLMKRSDKPIPLARRGDDEAAVVAIVAQRAAQLRDVLSEAVFLHRHAGPDAVHQVRLGDQLAPLFHEAEQGIEYARGEGDRVAGARIDQQACGRVEPEPVEFHDILTDHRTPISMNQYFSGARQ